MLVSRFYLNNALRNFNYLFVSEKTGRALCVDPLDHKLIYEYAKKKGWEISAIINTHAHNDHIAGNLPLQALSSAEIYATENLFQKIPGKNKKLLTGETLELGPDLNFRVLFTPGHTMDHICLYFQGDAPSLICGDTIFYAGVGNCYRGGDEQTLWHTIQNLLKELPQQTRLYPAHDYLEANLLFAHSLNIISNESARLLEQVQMDKTFSIDYVSTIEQEKKYNPFFIAMNLSSPQSKSEFLSLRQKRDKW